MSEDSPILEKATDQLCIDEVEIEKEEDELSDQVDVASSSKNDELSGIIADDHNKNKSNNNNSKLKIIDNNARANSDILLYKDNLISFRHVFRILKTAIT